MSRQVAYFVIPGELPAMNEMIGQNRLNVYAGAALKKRATKWVEGAVKSAGVQEIAEKVDLRCTWYCKNRRKDPDNTASAVKFILDGLVSAGVLENDGWKNVGRISHEFAIDKVAPRVEVGLYRHEKDRETRGKEELWSE